MLQYSFVSPVQNSIMTAFTIEGHLLNKANRNIFVSCELGDWDNVFNIFPIHYYGIDLDGYFVSDQRLQCFKCFSELISSGNHFESIPVKGVHAEVHGCNAE